MRLALLNRATPAAEFWIGSMLEQAEKVFAAASTPTCSSQKAIKSILESMLNAACVTGDLQKPALLNLLQRCGERIDNDFLNIQAKDDSSMEALIAGVLLEASAGDFKNPSDRLIFLRIVGRAYQEAAYGFRQADNIKGFNEAEAGCLRLAEWIAATETEAINLTPTQSEASATPQPAPPAGACAKCGFILTKVSAFCAQCGTPVVTAGPPPLPLRPESKVCSNCKKQLKLNAKFCSGCGKPV
jgi:RNA polymerase subunit RPABC4/transcription elongation factor Spt4